MACFKRVSTILTTGISSASFLRSLSFSFSPASELTTLKDSASFLTILPNSACKLSWYWESADFIDLLFVRRGQIFRVKHSHLQLVLVFPVSHDIVVSGN